MMQTRENGQKPRFDPPNRGTHFFFKNRASSPFSTHQPATLYAKSKKSYCGKYHNFIQTDGLTDRQAWIHRTQQGGSN